ncbi:MAG: ATP-binding cassette domain-containing protein [Bacteroidetes bacterium]|nr:ATP-binding cassette domain-containing protein [Bacteroidota bacterium]
MLKLVDISIKLGEFQLKDVNLELKKGDYYVLLGKSGAGKTVLLEIIAGMIKQDSGTVHLNDEDITNKKIHNRKVGIVFQNHSIFPHLTVKQNIAYSFKAKNITKSEQERLVNQYAELTQVTHLLARNTQKLSGGELQRVALARMLVSKPDCLLLDEPLASLDVQLQGGLRALLRQINQSGVTILHVTHDYEDAIALSNKVAVMHEGEIIQKGTTKEVFQKPFNEFVANFTGIKNFFTAVFSPPNTARINGKIEIRVSNNDQIKEGKIIIRGEEIILSNCNNESSATNNFKGVVKQIFPYMINYEVIIDIGIELSVVISQSSLQRFDFQVGTEAWVSFKSTAIKVIP